MVVAFWIKSSCAGARWRRNRGVASGIRVDGQWFTTKTGIATPEIVISKDTLTVTGIVFGKPGNEVHETWQFTVQADRIVWRITRKYSTAATLGGRGVPRMGFQQHVHLDRGNAG